MQKSFSDLPIFPRKIQHIQNFCKFALIQSYLAIILQFNSLLLNKMATPPVIYLAFANDQSGNPRHFLRSLQEECNDLQEILNELEDRGLYKVEAESNATPEEILGAFQKRFRDNIVVLHYAGHAGSNQLFLEGDKAGNNSFYAEGLAQIIEQQKNIKLVFLNGCATRAQADLLMNAGVPVVIATATKIDDENALVFATTFYRGIVGGATIWEAFHEAEGILKAKNKTVDIFRDLYWDDTLLPGQTELPWKLFYKNIKDTQISLTRKAYIPPDLKTEMIGKVIANHEITQYLGIGNLGYVFKAKHQTLGTEVAIKISHQILEGYEKVKQIMITGNKGLTLLNHKNIAKIYDVNELVLNELDKRFYIIMELVAGKRLDQIDLNIDTAHREEVKNLVNQILQILEGLRFAHELTYEDNLGFTIRGILHGNIKTRKIIFDAQNTPKLIDFMFMDVGRQKDVVMPLPPDVQAYFAQEQERVADYSAPEQIENGRVSEQTDIYSVGAVLFEVFTKQRLSDIPVQSEMDVYKWIKKRNMHIPFYVGTIIYRALRSNPADRYKHISEMIGDIIKNQSWWNRILYFLGVKKIR